jgi:hypothetical protein
LTSEKGFVFVTGLKHEDAITIADFTDKGITLGGAYFDALAPRCVVEF